ncbi:hypothetical protein BPS26883_01586 [Burkholderia pseudomultivorans]|uniref:Uncharacterized protein n=1 Tax=Burkholderia pseudomultivorans TaxID=1207504 RepID=A0A6P2J354_9BURK|nr:hypothetical protein BPS26883_01586 [Burkholderia pseudomultivorans]
MSRTALNTTRKIPEFMFEVFLKSRATGGIARASMPPVAVTRYLQLSIARPLMPPAVGA